MLDCVDTTLYHAGHCKPNLTYRSMIMPFVIVKRGWITLIGRYAINVTVKRAWIISIPPCIMQVTVKGLGLC